MCIPGFHNPKQSGSELFWFVWKWLKTQWSEAVMLCLSKRIEVSNFHVCVFPCSGVVVVVLLFPLLEGATAEARVADSLHALGTLLFTNTAHRRYINCLPLIGCLLKAIFICRRSFTLTAGGLNVFVKRPKMALLSQCASIVKCLFYDLCLVREGEELPSSYCTNKRGNLCLTSHGWSVYLHSCSLVSDLCTGHYFATLIPTSLKVWTAGERATLIDRGIDKKIIEWEKKQNNQLPTRKATYRLKVEDVTEEQSEGTGARRDTAEEEQSESRGGRKPERRRRAEHQQSHGKEGQHKEKERQRLPPHRKQGLSLGLGPPPPLQRRYCCKTKTGIIN